MKCKTFFLIDDGNNDGLFQLKVGGDKSKLINDNNAKRKVRVVSNTSSNNGVEDYIYNDNIGIKNCITIGTRGNDYFSCYQDDYTVTIVRTLLLHTNKFELNKYIGFYICALLRMNKYKCAYGRVLSGERLRLEKISLPVDGNDKPDWNAIEVKGKGAYNKFYKTINNKSITDDKIGLNTNEWKSFKISELFDTIEKAKCNNASDLLTSGDDIFYIGAKKDNNGTMEKVSFIDEMVSKGNAICFIGDGQGSIGYTTYQPFDFIGTTTLTIGYGKNLNKYNAMFLVTILDQERYRYSFGRKYGKTIISNDNTTIRLPATQQGEPDWEFMANYIKSLPYSASL